MDSEQYRKYGKEMVDYLVEYRKTIRERRVYPDVKPGYLHKLVPAEAPQQGEPYEQIFADLDRVIMPGVTHWQSPHMHAYFPALSSYPAMLAEMLSDGLNNLGFTWASSPACTELEILTTNWLGKMMALPEEFLNLKKDSSGGGVIQTTTSEATLVTLLAARSKSLKTLHDLNFDMEPAELNAYLVAYCSDQAHSSVEKDGIIALVRMHFVESDENLTMTGAKLEEMILKDKGKGLYPTWVCATLGTTGACSFDNLREVGEVCVKYGLWLHIDAAYAGSSFICPEFRYWLDGVEYADSIVVNVSKWFLVTFDSSVLWVKDSKALHKTFNVNPIYLQHENSGHAIDYMIIMLALCGRSIRIVVAEIHCYEYKNYTLHWQMGLSRRFRSLKLWFVMRSYGVQGLQEHIRKGVNLAKLFEETVLKDPRFEIPAPRFLGLVVFRLKGDNVLTERLLHKVTARGRVHCVPACLKKVYIIRFTVTSPDTTEDDILGDWLEFQHVASEILLDVYGTESGNIEHEINNADRRQKVPLKDISKLNPSFGTSLILANSPMSPKVVNGSFAALTDYDSIRTKFAEAASLCQEKPKDSPAMRRRIRGIKTSGKMFSLDSCMDMVHGLVSDEVKKQQLPQLNEGTIDEGNANSEAGQSADAITNTDLAAGQLSNCLLSVSKDANLYLTPPSSPNRQRSRSVDAEALRSTDQQVAKQSTDEALTDLDQVDKNNDSSYDEENTVWITPSVSAESPKKKPSSTSPGKYIQKIFQQFSETSFGADEKPETGLMANIKQNANAICKKCLHYKGKITNDQNGQSDHTN